MASIYKCIILFFIFSLSGCSSSNQSFLDYSAYNSVWGDDYYQETIYEIDIDVNKKTIVAFGDKYTYLIKSNELMDEYLYLDQFIDVDINFKNLVLDKDGLVKGYVTFEQSKESVIKKDQLEGNQEAFDQLKKAGVIFYSDSYIEGEEGSWSIVKKDFYFESKPDTAEENVPYAHLDNLLYLKVIDLTPTPVMVKVGKVIITPFAVVLDVVLIPFKLIGLSSYMLNY